MATRDGIITMDTLNLIMLLDRSISMDDYGRIDQLNQAIPVLKQSLTEVADEEGVEIKLRIISFCEKINWVVGSPESGVNIQDVVWHDLTTDYCTCTDLAIKEANKALKKQYLGAHALRPVVILITDGGCTNDHGDYLAAIEEMKRKLSGTTGKEKVTRIAVGVQDANRVELEEFASVGLYHDIEQPLVFEVQDVSELCKVINFAAVSSMYSSISDNSDMVVIDGDPDDFI